VVVNFFANSPWIGGDAGVRSISRCWPPFPAKTWPFSWPNDPVCARIASIRANQGNIAVSHLPGALNLHHGGSHREGAVLLRIVHGGVLPPLANRSAYLAREN